MSLRFEQYNSLKMTRRFLHEIIMELRSPVSIMELRERALRCLRHFPALDDQGQPYWSQDEFTKDRE